MKKLVITLLLAVCLISCATSRPVFYTLSTDGKKYTDVSDSDNAKRVMLLATMTDVNRYSPDYKKGLELLVKEQIKKQGYCVSGYEIMWDTFLSYEGGEVSIHIMCGSKE